MTRDQMKSLIDRLHLIWNTGDLAAVPDVYSADFVVHWPGSSGAPVSRGHAGIEKAIRETRSAFPDWHERIVDMIIDGDRVVTRYVSTGTHEGDYRDIAATGRRVEIDEVSIFRIEDGKVAEQWCMVDELTFLRQLGQL